MSGGSVAEIFINFIALVVDGSPIWNCRRVDAEKIRQLPLEARFSTCLIVWRAYAEKNATLFIGKSNHNCSFLASSLSKSTNLLWLKGKVYVLPWHAIPFLKGLGMLTPNPWENG